jgi:hypothetical protein
MEIISFSLNSVKSLPSYPLAVTVNLYVSAVESDNFAVFSISRAKVGVLKRRSSCLVTFRSQRSILIIYFFIETAISFYEFDGPNEIILSKIWVCAI